jgi:(R,R)-butanediol dehydrogenase / meso-butanediol dehydrogenase / diacetyl reductase
MKAAVFHGAQDIRVEEVAAPAGPGPHDVLLRPLWCGICGTDLHEYAMGPIVIPAEPHALNGSQLPQVLGHEFSGEVVGVGSDVSSVQVGQRVSVMPLLYCGECYYCRRGLNHLCQSMACVGLSYDWGGISELAVVPASHVSVLPDEVTDLQGALVEPGAVAAYGVDTAGVSPGDSVLVTGAGPIGALAALYSAAAGVRVFVSEVNPVRRDLALSLGVGEVVDPTSVDVASWIKDRTEGVGVDAVIECSGNERALQTALVAVRSAGRISQTGLHTKAASIEPMVLAEHDITLAGTWCYPVSDWPRIIGLISSGRYPVEKVVTAQIGMDDVVKAGFETLLDPSGDQVKVLVQAR